MQVCVQIDSSSVQVVTAMGTGTSSVLWGKHFEEDNPAQSPVKNVCNPLPTII